MDFLPSLAVEILGGLATGVVLAAAAAGYAAWRSYHSHDAALRDLRDDTRRWLRDRDRDLQVQTNAAITTMAARGLLYAGAFLTALADLKRQALQEYRDEMSRKRTRYRGLLGRRDMGAPAVPWQAVGSLRTDRRRQSDPRSVAGTSDLRGAPR